MGGYLGLGDLGSDIQDPNCSEARSSIHSLSLRGSETRSKLHSSSLRRSEATFVDSGWGLRGHIVDQDLIRNGAQTVPDAIWKDLEGSGGQNGSSGSVSKSVWERS